MDEKQVFIDEPKQTAVNEPRDAALNAGSAETLDQLRAAANIPYQGVLGGTLLAGVGDLAKSDPLPKPKFSLLEIPKIMRHFGFLNGARFQERWFSSPARVVEKDFDPKNALNAPRDTTTIKMKSWVLTFDRARAVYDNLMQERAWANPAAQDEIREMIKRKASKGLLGKQKPGKPGRSFGDLDTDGKPLLPVEQLDEDSIQFRPVSWSIRDLFKLDDMFCALANFTFRVVVAGSVEPVLSNRGTHLVTIDRVGVYVRDSFDFEGDQDLGFWADSPPYLGAFNNKDRTAVPVDNSKYSEWRKQNGRGGDFLVFSDVLPTLIDPPKKFII